MHRQYPTWIEGIGVPEFRPGITSKEIINKLIDKYIPAIIDLWLYKFTAIYLPITQPKQDRPPRSYKEKRIGRVGQETINNTNKISYSPH